MHAVICSRHGPENRSRRISIAAKINNLGEGFLETVSGQQNVEGKSGMQAGGIPWLVACTLDRAWTIASSMSALTRAFTGKFEIDWCASHCTR